jgi:ribosomal protein S18 acetylase RimI-like enzyme
VAASTRGLGIGRRVLDCLEALARRRRVRVLRLETNRTLSQAQAPYHSGYREVPAFNDESYAHHWFEKVLRAG